MKRRFELWHIAWGLVGILFISMITLALSPKPTAVTPDATSYDPGGTSAFAALLTKAGYRVVIDHHVRPFLDTNDIAICFIYDDAASTSAPFDGDAPPDQGDLASDGGGPISDTIDSINDWTKEGGSALWLPVPKETGPTKDFEVSNFPGADHPLHLLSVDTLPQLQIGDASGIAEIGNISQVVSAAHLGKLGKGYEMEPYNGYIALNDAIAKGDNARILLRLVGMLRPPGARVVFVTGAFGESSPVTVMEAIGPWAEAAWRQFLLLLVVIGITLGCRFGLPDEDARRKEQGARELVEGLAGLFERSRAYDRALKVSLRRAEFLIRRRLKLGNDAPLESYRELIPADVWDALNQVRVLIGSKPPEAFVLSAVQKLDKAVSSFTVAPSRRRR
jgi:hypothetical protein